MNKKMECLVGHDSDGLGGFLIALIIGAIVIMVCLALMVWGGAFIGLFHSVKNYFISLKHNVIDSNRKPVRAK